MDVESHESTIGRIDQLHDKNIVKKGFPSGVIRAKGLF